MVALSVEDCFDIRWDMCRQELALKCGSIDTQRASAGIPEIDWVNRHGSVLSE